MRAGSKPVPPGTPPPSPPPSGPTHPTPTAPPKSVPSDATVLRQFDDTLLALAAITHVDPLFRGTVPTIADGDPVTDLRFHLRKALSAARRVAAMHHQTPARRSRLEAAAPSGGPVQDLPVGLGERSRRLRATPNAGAGSGGGEGGSFSLPRPLGPQRFESRPDAAVLATVVAGLRAKGQS